MFRGKFWCVDARTLFEFIDLEPVMCEQTSIEIHRDVMDVYDFPESR